MASRVHPIGNVQFVINSSISKPLVLLLALITALGLSGLTVFVDILVGTLVRVNLLTLVGASLGILGLIQCVLLLITCWGYCLSGRRIHVTFQNRHRNIRVDTWMHCYPYRLILKRMIEIPYQSVRTIEMERRYVTLILNDKQNTRLRVARPPKRKLQDTYDKIVTLIIGDKQ